jgi:hypothetical protein
MHRKRLQEIAKFGAGLVLGDFVAILWIANANLLPVEFLGRVITMDLLIPGLIFDAALFLILVHYGWNIGKIPALRERGYLLVSGAIFGVVAVAHLARIFSTTDIALAGWSVPVWLSWVGVAVTTYLAYMSFRLAMRSK